MSRPHDEPHRFRRLATYFRERYGERIYKIGLRGGFTCPNRDGTLGDKGCAFCAGESTEPASYRANQDIEEQLRGGIDYIRARHGATRFVAYYQDYTATYAPARRLEALYDPALAHADVVEIAVGTRPDCLDEATLELLTRLNEEKALWVELGLQLADDALLESMGRGHDVSCFVDAAKRLSALGLRVCAHVIIGYPGASKEIEAHTATLLAELNFWGVKLHAFHVLRGTALATRFEEGALPLLTLHEHAERVARFLERLPETMIVHRVTAEASRQLTLGPDWTINKMQAFDAVLDGLVKLDSWQGKALGATRPG